MFFHGVLVEHWRTHLSVEYSKNKFTCALTDILIQDDKYKIVSDIIYYNDGIYLVLES